MYAGLSALMEYMPRGSAVNANAPLSSVSTGPRGVAPLSRTRARVTALPVWPSTTRPRMTAVPVWGGGVAGRSRVGGGVCADAAVAASDRRSTQASASRIGRLDAADGKLALAR